MLNSRRENSSEILLNFDDNMINAVPRHNHLGLTFDTSGTWNAQVERMISNTLKRVGILRNLKYKVKRECLVTMYNAYIRPILEYADVVWDSLPDYLTHNVEKVQVEALRVITGLTVSCSSAHLYKESGYAPLLIRRKYHRLIMLYKIVHNEAPVYLTDLLPPRVGDVNRHNLRNQEDFILLPVRTESYNKSFFPQTIRDWNQLPLGVKEAQSIGVFKTKLKHILFDSSPDPWFYHENTRFSGIQHTRLRGSCSALNHHLYVNHVKDNPRCPYCPNFVEDPHHYFLECGNFVNQRRQMSNKFLENFPRVAQW
jgi:hypothetical protein